MSSKSWPDFWSENKKLLYLLLVVVFVWICYLVYARWSLKFGGLEVNPPNSSMDDKLNHAEKPQRNNSSEKDLPKSAIEGSKTQPDISPKMKMHKSRITGLVLDSIELPAVSAKISCSNCLESNSPVYTDATGHFAMDYELEYKEQDFPVKSIELTVYYQKRVFTYSQSITQNSLIIELK